jgi:hypothetical protein
VGLQAQLWRGIAAFRFASLGYAAVLLVADRADYRRLVLAWVVLDHAPIVGGRRRAVLSADTQIAVVRLLSQPAAGRGRRRNTRGGSVRRSA